LLYGGSWRAVGTASGTGPGTEIVDDDSDGTGYGLVTMYREAIAAAGAVGTRALTSTDSATGGSWGMLIDADLGFGGTSAWVFGATGDLFSDTDQLLAGSSAWTYAATGALAANSTLLGQSNWVFGATGALRAAADLSGPSAWDYTAYGSLSVSTPPALPPPTIDDERVPLTTLSLVMPVPTIDPDTGKPT
jgi:hypothetical protein